MPLRASPRARFAGVRLDRDSVIRRVRRGCAGASRTSSLLRGRLEDAKAYRLYQIRQSNKAAGFFFAPSGPYLFATAPARLPEVTWGEEGGLLEVPNTIALVDDDRNILTSVSMALEAEGFTVRCYSDGTEALKGLSAQPVDIAVLDIKMPRMDGMELLNQLRRQSHIPVIFLTSKDDGVDELLGLRMGADDYIKKPFSQRLLIERIRALTRRGVLARERGEPQAEPVIVRGHLILDPARHLCTWKGEPVELTLTEFLIFYSLAYRQLHVKHHHILIDGKD